jgi:hypothetical protein
MSVPDLIKSIHAAAGAPSVFNEEERTNLLAACERLRGRLESPRDEARRILFAVSYPHSNPIIDIQWSGCILISTC